MVAAAEGELAAAQGGEVWGVHARHLHSLSCPLAPGLAGRFFQELLGTAYLLQPIAAPPQHVCLGTGPMPQPQDAPHARHGAKAPSDAEQA